jgi:hypothetical protein
MSGIIFPLIVSIGANLCNSLRLFFVMFKCECIRYFCNILKYKINFLTFEIDIF